MAGDNLTGSAMLSLSCTGVDCSLPYASPNRDRNFRVLWHQTLDELIRYKEVPHATFNFDADAIEKPVTASTRTLTSNVTTRFSSVFGDMVVEEVWRGELATFTGMFYNIHRFLLEDLDDGDDLVWLPKDLNDKAYLIEPLDLVVGDSSKMDVNPISEWREYDRRFLRAEVRFVFRIRKPFRKPNAVVFLQGS